MLKRLSCQRQRLQLYSGEHSVTNMRILFSKIHPLLQIFVLKEFQVERILQLLQTQNQNLKFPNRIANFLPFGLAILKSSMEYAYFLKCERFVAIFYEQTQGCSEINVFFFLIIQLDHLIFDLWQGLSYVSF